MAEFLPALQKVLNLEGGYQNDPADWGNYNAYSNLGVLIPYSERPGVTLRAGTNRGISAALYSSLKGREVSVAEMQAISQQQAGDIYRQVYWDKIKGDQIKDQGLAELVFDSHVNHGTSGIKLVQRVLNRMGESLAEDGVVGPLTLAAINRVSIATLYNGLLEARRQLYNQLSQSRPGNERFLEGWLNRLKKFPAMVAEAVRANPDTSSVLLGLGIAAGLYYLAGNNQQNT